MSLIWSSAKLLQEQEYAHVLKERVVPNKQTQTFKLCFIS